MPIYYHDKDQIFHLQSKNMSYLIQIVNGHPLHIYWGKQLKDLILVMIIDWHDEMLSFALSDRK